MPHFVTPNSYGTVKEFNACHTPTGAEGGQFCSGEGSVRAVPIRVTSLDHAVELLMKGRRIELARTSQVNTLLTRLGKIALDAKAKGEKAPHYDLCNVSVPGTNKIFCGDKLRTKEHPNGVPRAQMPQFSGTPVPGSPADKLARKQSEVTGKHDVDGAPAFIAHMQSLGIRTSRGEVAASRLKATQSELVGAKVAAMMTKPGFDPGAKPIFISRDNYVIDGHHRWAAVVGRDAANGRLGELKIKVVRVNAPIRAVLKLAQKWTKDFGIQVKTAKEAAVARRRAVIFS